MRICEYIKDKAGILIGYLLFIAVMLIAFRAMRTPGELTVIFLVLTVLLLVTVILTDYKNADISIIPFMHIWSSWIRNIWSWIR